MKQNYYFTFFAFIISIIFAQTSFAFTITDVSFSPEQKKIFVDVIYNGECEEHNFKLQISNECIETKPAKYFAEVIQTSGENDPCKGLVDRRLEFDYLEASKVPVLLVIFNKHGSSKELLISDSDSAAENDIERP